MGLLPDTKNCGLRMRRLCRERFPRDRLQKKPVVSNPGIHHGTCVTYVSWCMSGSLTGGGGENDPAIPAARETRNFTYLARGQYLQPCQTFRHIIWFQLTLPYGAVTVLKIHSRTDELWKSVMCLYIRYCLTAVCYIRTPLLLSV